jgi:Fimbrial assembly protein (PilN)
LSQQINLFNPLFLKQKRYFSAVTMLQALGLLVLGMAGFYAFTVWQDGQLARQVEESTRTYEQQKQQFARVTTDLSPERREAQLDNELKNTESAIAARQALLRDMQMGITSDSTGYSEYLRAFARQTVQGLWLTGIQIAGGDGQLMVSGRALEADLVPVLIGRLKREPVLSGRLLEGLTISRSVATTGQVASRSVVDFTVNSPSTGKGVPPAAEKAKS